MQSEALLEEIEDSGPGIDPENRQKIFEPFYTTKSSGKEGELGLSVSRKIIMDHAGKMDCRQVRSVSGSLFSVTLPLTE